MTDFEKKVAAEYIYRELWYKQYIDLLVKAGQFKPDAVDILVKLSKPTITDEQLTQLLVEAFTEKAPTQENN